MIIHKDICCMEKLRQLRQWLFEKTVLTLGLEKAERIFQYFFNGNHDQRISTVKNHYNGVKQFDNKEKN